LLLYWLALGLPLAWSKGTWTCSRHRWIGADFIYQPASEQAEPDPTVEHKTTGRCIMSVPEAFAEDLHEKLEPLTRQRGHVRDHDLDIVLGKCGRLAYLIPACRPWVSALWGALAGSRSAAASGRRPEAPRGCHAAQRFRVAARWLRTLLKPPAARTAAPWLPLETYVVADLTPITVEGPCVQVDASPWGGGAALQIAGQYVEHASITWSPQTAKRFKVQIGSPRGQTIWEYMIILLALELWASRFRSAGLAVLGDNLAALGGALGLKGANELNRITREIAWRKVRGGWHYACGHLPSELNEVADSLSRTMAPRGNRKDFPRALSASTHRTFADPESLWTS
jgi:hypothetical protein